MTRCEMERRGERWAEGMRYSGDLFERLVMSVEDRERGRGEQKVQKTEQRWQSQRRR